MLRKIVGEGDPRPPFLLRFSTEAADNVFFHLTYEGAVDMGVVRDEVELKALETQINEFGQVWMGCGQYGAIEVDLMEDPNPASSCPCLVGADPQAAI